MLEGSPGASFLNGMFSLGKDGFVRYQIKSISKFLDLFVNKGGTAMSLVLFWMRGIFYFKEGK
ncbi:hypothetical protein CO726_11375 [Bacillus fungorum]|uniref:Uncharacterized protein n=1 Tax=Bacillus fungorum TaxID=2039284 RepID=A0A2G6QEJ7_9BACI|nr:hypothetical protein CO726_11375 [Bacillus fungorum]